MIADRKAGSSRLKYWFEPGVSLSILSFSSAPSSGLLLFAGLVVASLDIALQWKRPPPLSTSCRPPLSRQQPPSLTLLFRESRRITSMVKPTKPKILHSPNAPQPSHPVLRPILARPSSSSTPFWRNWSGKSLRENLAMGIAIVVE